ncbi:hypothetical protein ABVT39_005611 [Epinephelus coioides]
MKGISNNPEQVALSTTLSASALSKSLDEMSNDAKALDKTMKPKRHKEEGKGWQEFDVVGRGKILRVLPVLLTHSPQRLLPSTISETARWQMKVEWTRCIEDLTGY